MRIEKITGPRCTSCGSQDSEDRGQREWFGVVHSQRACRRCGTRWNVPMPRDDDAPIAVPPPGPETGPPPAGLYRRDAETKCVCPECETKNPPVTRSKPPQGGTVIRYHRCKCGATFKTAEKV